MLCKLIKMRMPFFRKKNPSFPLQTVKINGKQSEKKIKIFLNIQDVAFLSTTSFFLTPFFKFL